MGFDTYVGHGFEAASKKTTIGKYCSIGRFVCIGTGQHPTDLLSTHTLFYSDMPFGPNLPPECRCKYDGEHPPCHIGNDVWIGRNAVIKDGVTVGDGAIIDRHERSRNERRPAVCNCRRRPCKNNPIPVLPGDHRSAARTALVGSAHREDTASAV